MAVEVKLHTFLTSAVLRRVGSASCHSHCKPVNIKNGARWALEMDFE
jgi:hypothetical protein